MTTSEQEGGRSALGRSLLEAKAMTSDWAPSFAAVPRSAFLPELMWPFDMAEQTSVPVSKADDPAAWQGYADADVPIVTQWDDGGHSGTSPGKVSTSSASMPSVVFAMLADLDVSSGHTVLEIGTGTGWNAGLLTHRLGDGRVSTVEVDASVAAAARTALHHAGVHPTVVTGDGFEGYAPKAPYDRVIGTCGMREIPYAWVQQTKPGGLIVAPWGTHFGNGDAVARLVVRDGVATGRFTRLVEFMKLRAQRRTGIRHGDYVPAEGIDAAGQSTTTVPGEEFVTGTYTVTPFALGLRVRDCAQAVAEKRGDTRPVWFYGLSDRSWAVVIFRDGDREAEVYQAGPRRLWDEVEAAWHWWDGQGRPGIERFGLTVTAEGQTAWLDDPARSWPV